MTTPQSESSANTQAHPLLIKRLLETGLRRATPRQEIVYGDTLRLTYPQFGERVNRLAAGLRSLGVSPGDTVAVMDWDSHRYLECFFAVPMMGAVLHTINVRLSPEQILYTINHAKDDLILVNAEFLSVLEQIRPQIEPGKRLVLLDDRGETGTLSPEFVAEYESLLAGSSVQFDFPELDENTRATTFYTTGTTGVPKGVYFSHRQLVLHALALRGTLAGTGQGRFNDGDVYMPITPLFHVHAWGMPYLATMVGVKQVYPGRYAPKKLVDLVQREGVSFSHCVPTILQSVLDEAEARQADLHGLTVVIGGAALAQSLVRRALGMGVDIFAGYGMSETGPVLTLSQLQPSTLERSEDEQIDARCRAGLPISMVELRIVDTAMNDVPRDGNATGEIVARAPWLTPGYLYDAANSAQLWRDGWLHTGDIGLIDADGYLRITDRLKDVIKTGGEWVSSLAIEDLLQRHPSIAEAAVIGVPDPKWTERPLAIVVPKPDQFVDSSELKRHLSAFATKGVISKYGVPDRIVFVDALPKTSVGKIDKKLLRAQVINQLES
jgi:fatty-acyl-CoA synthase